MASPLLTREYVLSRLEYKDGELYWKERPREEFKREQDYKRWKLHIVGTKAGAKEGKYKKVLIYRYGYFVHRIIFLMHHGYMPSNVDHIDGNPNNRIENLRAATRFENLSNMKLCKRNSSGYKGVSWSKNLQKWRARLHHHRKEILVGYFFNIEDAATAISAAREKIHGAFARHE